MKIVIRSQGLEISAALREHVERRAHFAFDWADHQLSKVSILLADLNGPRGGDDKRCRMLLTVPGMPRMVIEDTETDLYVAIDRAADRAARTLARRLARQREYRNPDLASARDGVSWHALDVGEVARQPATL
ncbi:HPF/RaiA family ribosome-associated protein [Accumulibacter sp.]|uniref:HPF/RaiA family ribosome-associated protein n=1 Tax=Accumulibacter sp. TaxID=2053492 RepID=UPI0025D3E647|nr:HPF/RaiA family ribosome-associated protein [Accumulibacter sp.]MCM8595445.1 HPF/RaiA family ribosome-associated protein [Accumulibacter sp.]MCM8626374.1 HPF/RaiA family ribosome-associated protein [Accumulibacter sp.]MDS4049592.1 HPF/RaiA family ribosome-associated protein [Accumulibacter sp.]